MEILDDNIYEGNKINIRTEKISLYERSALIGSVAFTLLTILNLYKHGLIYWNAFRVN